MIVQINWQSYKTIAVYWGVNIQNLCDYVIIDKIQDGVRFGRKNLNMRYPHTRIIIPVYSHHYSWLLSLFHASIQLVILGNHFCFVPMVQILCDYIIIDAIRCQSDVICNGIVSKQNTRFLYVFDICSSAIITTIDQNY